MSSSYSSVSSISVTCDLVWYPLVTPLRDVFLTLEVLRRLRLIYLSVDEPVVLFSTSNIRVYYEGASALVVYCYFMTLLSISRRNLLVPSL